MTTCYPALEPRVRVRRSILFLIFASAGCAQLTPKQKTDSLESFEIVWRTVRDRHPDPKLNGLDWQAIHDQTRPLIARARSASEVRDVLTEMLGRLNASHYAIIPSGLYQATVATPDTKPVSHKSEAKSESHPAPVVIAEKAIAASADHPEPDPKGKLVTFGNLPESRLFFESRELASGAGYIRFNEFLDPVSIMPQFEAALKQFAKSPGVILDLRGNPGGIGIMAMGVAGFFVSEPGLKLGEMKMRDADLNFVIFPRADSYAGLLAILVDAGSASTTEILAQGLQDLGRARIFGTRTAGAALPSDIIRLPDGDGFQFAQASYTSVKGKVLEGSGVTPDVEVRQTEQALSAGHDLVIEAAETWISSVRR